MKITKIITWLFLGLLLGSTAGAQTGKVTFVERTGSTYVFKFKGNIIRTTCGWTDKYDQEGNKVKTEMEYCPLGLLPNDTLPIREGVLCKAGDRWGVRTVVEVDSETVLVVHEHCTNIRGDWLWAERGNTIWFDVISIKAETNK